MRLLMDGEIPAAEWETLIRENDCATPFQSPGFYNLFNSADGLSATAFAVADGSVIRALVVVTYQRERGLKGYFSRRSIIYGGPVIDGNSPVAADMLLKAVVKYSGKRSIYTEVRNLSDFGSFRELFAQNGFQYVPYLNFRIDTRDRDEMFGRISSSRQRQIRKASKISAYGSEASDIEEVRQFYTILRNLYSEKLRKPLPCEDFFLEFYRRNLGKYLLIKHEGKVIGGIMCPVIDRRSIYEFYICGLDEDFPHLYPSVMATWSAMEYANKNGIPLFDLMGAGKAAEQYGVREFKARFGGELVEYGRFLRINKPVLYRTGKAGLGIMKKVRI